MRLNMVRAAVSLFIIIVTSGVAFLYFTKDRAKENFQKACELRDNGSLLEATDLFGQIAALHPGSEFAEKALFELGFTHYAIEYPGAPEGRKATILRLSQDAFEQVVAKYRESTYSENANRYLAEIYRLQGMFPEALKCYKEMEKRTPNPQDQQQLYNNMAECFEEQQDFQRAAEYYEAIISLGAPGNIYEEAHFAIAQHYRILAENDDERSELNHEKLIILLKNLTESSSEISDMASQRALVLTAHSLLSLKRFDEASTILDRLDKMAITSTNLDLIQGYRDRLKRHREMGQR